MAVEKLQRYDLLHRLAEGGMGEVFVGRVSGEHGFEKLVAVKRVLPELARDRDFVVRFVQEAKLTVSLSHANIVQVFDLGRTGDALFLVMEYVDGSDLGGLVALGAAAARPLSYALVVHIAMEALKALVYAHERVDARGAARGLLHCDISASNLLVSYAGEVKLTDFGIAEVMNARTLRDRGTVFGKPRYMSTEQRAGDALDVRTDIYSLGVVMQEMVADRTDCPAELRAVIERATRMARDDRQASARQMLTELMQVARLLEPVTAPDLGSYVRALVPLEEEIAATPQLADALVQAAGRRRTITNAIAGAATDGKDAPAPTPPDRVTYMATRLADGTLQWQTAAATAQATQRQHTRQWLLAAAAAFIVTCAAGIWYKTATASAPTVTPSKVVAAPAVAAPANGVAAPADAPAKVVDVAAKVVDVSADGAPAKDNAPTKVVAQRPQQKRKRVSAQPTVVPTPTIVQPPVVESRKADFLPVR